MDRLLRVCLVCLALGAGGFVPAALADSERDKANAQLQEVRSRISELREQIESDGRRRSRAEQALARIEQEEQQVRRELADVRERLKTTRSKQQELERQLAREEAELAREQAALSQQLRVAYVNGSEEWLRVVLSQQDATALGRRMVYYSYLSRQRSSTIASLRALLLQLEETRAGIAREARQLVELEENVADKLVEIADARGERARLVAKIAREMEGKGAEVARLKGQEQELGELVAALARMLPDMPDVNAEPFAGQAAKLDWPARGPLLKRFGQQRAGGLKWQGVLVGAPAGSDVQSVYHGRVIFSDWLDGMGLLMIVEHGDGYMSLYGHNQDLLKEVGEWVEPGEIIAHVGDSGGKSAAGLYFEIRKNGNPVNPANWIR